MENTNDIVYLTIGNFGKSQLFISISMGILKITVGWFQLSILFLAPQQDFWCKTKNNDSTSINNETYLNKCYISDDSGANVPCKDFEYDNSIISSTIISEWNLICSKAYLVDLTQMSFMTGNLLGFIIFGAMADNYGRKIPLCIAIVVQSLSCFVSAFSLKFSIFIAARFLLAICNGGIIVVSLVMCIEIVGGKWRTIIPILYQIPFAFGIILLAILAYLLREWRHIQLSLSILSLIPIICFFFISESPRWLMVTNQKEKAFVSLKKMAKFNKMEWNDSVEQMLNEYKEESKNKRNTKTFGLLFSNRKNIVQTLILSVEWFGSGVVFFGFAQYMGTISKNMYVSAGTSSLSVIIGILLSLPTAQYLGRKKTIMIFETLTGICFLLILFFPKGIYSHDWPRLLFSSMAAFGISVFFPVMSLFSGETFPTIVRNFGMGLMFTACKIGSILAPLMLSLERISWYLPLTIMGITSIFLASMIIPLSETKDKNISNTIDIDQSANCSDMKI